MPSFLAMPVDDALVGLVRHQPVDFFRLDAVGRRGLVHRRRQLADGVPEDALPVHAYMPVVPVLDGPPST